MNDIMYINASRSPLVPSVYILWGIKWWHLKGIMPPPKTCLLNPGMEKKNESIVKPGMGSCNRTWYTSELAVCQIIFESKIRTVETSTCSFPSVLLLTCSNHSIPKAKVASLTGSSLFPAFTWPWIYVGHAWMESIKTSLVPKYPMKYLDKISTECVRILKKKKQTKQHKHTYTKKTPQQPKTHKKRWHRIFSIDKFPNSQSRNIFRGWVRNNLIFCTFYTYSKQIHFQCRPTLLVGKFKKLMHWSLRVCSLTPNFSFPCFSLSHMLDFWHFQPKKKEIKNILCACG